MMIIGQTETIVNSLMPRATEEKNKEMSPQVPANDGFSNESGFIVTQEQMAELRTLHLGLVFKRYTTDKTEASLYVLQPFRADVIAENYEELRTWVRYDSAYTKQLNTLKDTSWLNGYLTEGQPTLPDVISSKVKEADALLKAPNPGEDSVTDLQYGSTKLTQYFFEEEEVLLDLNGVQGRLILDLDGSNSLNNVAEVLKKSDLIAFDSNRDGLIDKNDAFFSKLKVITRRADGEQRITPLSSLMRRLEVIDFAKDDATFRPGDLFQKSDLLRYADPVYTHAEYTSVRMDRFLQSQNVGSSGWIKRNGANESFFATLGYERTNLDGQSYIQTSRGFSDRQDEASLKIVQEQRFEKLYREYKKTKAAVTHENKALALELMRTDIGVDHSSVMNFSNPYLKTLEMEFERLTGLSFSSENLERVHKRILEGKAVDTLRDRDTITAMKRNDDGTYQLRFDSGRSIEVDRLFFDTGSFLRDGQYRGWIILDMDLSWLAGGSGKNGADGDGLAVWEEGRLKTLKDAGIQDIELKQFDEEEQIQVLLQNGDGTKSKAEGLYGIENLEDSARFSTPEERDAIINHPYADSGNGDNVRTVAKT